ncbi:54S ribosomal protein L8, mitochondrial [Blastocladiella emersonii ATCC 22665]|nr:54S ribosomal protein L8, mitochondrial [Blastocladiella emersonii ATCC 22665]
MRHGLAQRKLGRDSPHRRALLRNLVSSLVLHDRIRTTLPKAKEAQAIADKMVTLAKKGTPQARVQASGYLFQTAFTVPKLFDQMAARYAARPGGYTRIIKCGRDRVDSSPMAILEYVDAPGDTKLEMSKQELPALRRKLKDLRDQERAIQGTTAPIAVPGNRPPRRIFSEDTLSELQRKMRALGKVESKLAKVARLPFLPTGYEEQKFPAKHQEIRVEKKVWTEPLNDTDRFGRPRSVVKVKRTLHLVNVDPAIKPADKKIPKIKNQHHAV